MKKFLLFCSCALIILIFSVEFVLAGLDFVPHVLIGSVSERSGGNSRTNNPEGNEWAEEYYGKTRNIIWTYPTANSPVAKGKIPTQKDGLINAEAPVVLKISSNKNEIVMGFDDEIGSQYYSVRLLDNKGNDLGGKIKGDGLDLKVYSVAISPEPKNYYIEFAEEVHEYNSRTSKMENKGKYYCYVLVKISVSKPTAMKTEINPASAQDYQKGMRMAEIFDEYMKAHNITDGEQLTIKDFDAVNKIYNSRYGSQEDNNNMKGLIRSLQSSQNPYKHIFDAYMKKHGIKNYNDLSAKDLEEIGKLIEAQENSTKTPNKKSSSKKKRK